ncbi:MAG TPA: AAA family ATPase, partial [Chitinophagales bacterium]|nr:AAA family ATPase [Chitinophagales bacterium]
MEENFVFQETNPEIQQLQQAVYAVRAELSKVIIGQQQMMDLLIAGLLAGGHILIEGVPGIAKTLTAKMLAQTVAADFSRIQFTPDLMPTDVLGTSVFNQKTTE